jgi:hypothetical protein
MEMTKTATRQTSDGLKSGEEERSRYNAAETQFELLMATDELDENLGPLRLVILDFERTLKQALFTAYQGSGGSEPAHQFLQRVLYRINRLKLFWYDDLRQYKNERSVYLGTIRDRIEEAWQSWEIKFLEGSALKEKTIDESLMEESQRDLTAETSESGVFFRDHVGEAGYRRLLAITSLDGLVEASQLSRMLGGVANEIHSTLTKLFLEEYGGGRLARKHSTYFKAMLSEFDMRTEPEAYFDVVPWEILAGINHSFLLTERKRYFLRYIGGLLYTEVSVPSAFRPYSAAAKRLDLPQTAMGYWDLHIKEDERHGRWMLYDVALPLAKRYPDDAWELLLGYKQQRLMGQRIGEAIARSARIADSESRKIA